MSHHPERTARNVRPVNQPPSKEKLFRKRSGRLRFLDRIDRIYKIMSIDELCYKVIGSAMAVHRHFGTGYLEEVYKTQIPYLPFP